MNKIVAPSSGDVTLEMLGTSNFRPALSESKTIITGGRKIHIGGEEVQKSEMKTIIFIHNYEMHRTNSVSEAS